MTRHAKNNTASSVYSYHERQRDTQNSGYGTQKKRLGKDSVKDFNACNLTLQPCRHPVITQDGYLYDKEAILEYIVHKKVEIMRQMKQYEKDKNKDKKELEELAELEMNVKAENFSKKESKVFRDKSDMPSTSNNGNSVSNMDNGKNKELPSFWIPNLTPSSSKEKLKKPSSSVLCPMSGKPLKASHLISIQFTPVDSNCTDYKKAQYKCPVSHDILCNSTKCVVLRTSGSVVTEECVNKIIMKDMIDPINGKTMKTSDFIPLQRGGTGYSSANELKAQISRPVLTA